MWLYVKQKIALAQVNRMAPRQIGGVNFSLTFVRFLAIINVGSESSWEIECMLGKPAAIMPQDLVLVHIDHKPAFFARVEDINPDYKRGWWHVKLFVLALPMKTVTWTIDDEQIRGADFTMGGTPVRLEKVRPPREESGEETAAPAAETEAAPGNKQARILSFTPKASE